MDAMACPDRFKLPLLGMSTIAPRDTYPNTAFTTVQNTVLTPHLHGHCSEATRSCAVHWSPTRPRWQWFVLTEPCMEEQLAQASAHVSQVAADECGPTMVHHFHQHKRHKPRAIDKAALLRKSARELWSVNNMTHSGLLFQFSWRDGGTYRQ